MSAWATQNQLVLDQTKVADKSNEITAISDLLQLPDISGCTVTIDATEPKPRLPKTVRATISRHERKPR